MMLQVAGLASGYPGGGQVLHGVDLQVGAAERVALMGRNGMGKSTLLRALMGHLKAHAGTVRFGDGQLTGKAPFEVSNAGIGYVPQGREVFADFTVEENLLLGLIGKPLRPVQVPDAIYARFPILRQRRGQRAGTLSGGEQQQLAIARAIIGRPRLLLLDEPSEGIQPSIVHEMGEALARISADESMSVLLVEQNLELVAALTTRCLFMENGRVVGESRTAALAHDTSLLERYLSV
jgi:branched-chain amino acid transport system ATP-binding protein/urea transport system ATP-binding protein